jgi:nitrogen fixation NifU-like protein
LSEMYTERLLDHYRHPRNEGHLDSADLAAELYNPLCGDRVKIEARLKGDQIVEARFSGRGCALCLGAASILTQFIRGRNLADLLLLDNDDFLGELESPIRQARLKCALLPWLAFRKAAYGEEAWLP